jgi:DNA-binding response OmpR family regulator
MSAEALQTQTRLRFDHADVLLFDPVFANRHTLRTSLEMVGFRHITVVQDLHEIPELVRGHLFDLFVADVTQHTEKLCAIVRHMREGKSCANPFAHVVLMAWKLDNDIVRRALNCGADEFVTRPFSVSFLGARVRASTQARANFVVTGDYVGPDRRRDRARRGSAPIFHAPNSLQIKCSEAYDPSQAAALRHDIDTAKEQVGVDRIRRSSVQIPHLIPELKQAFTDMDPLEPHLAHLMVIARDTLERAEHAGLKGVLEAAKPLVNEIAGAQSGASVAAHIDAIERCAGVLFLVVNPTGALDQLKQEIERARAQKARR